MVNLQTYKEVFPNWAAISLETTGLKPDWDEILKITVIDHYGRAVLDELYKPCRHQSWSDAEKLNGISFQMVRNKSYIRGKANKISDILKEYDFLVTNNTKFCVGFLDMAHISYPTILGIGKIFQELLGNGHRMYASMENILDYYGVANRMKTHSKLDNIRYIYLRLTIEMGKILALLDDAITEPTTGCVYRPFLTEEQRLHFLMAARIQDYADIKVKELKIHGQPVDILGIIDPQQMGLTQSVFVNPSVMVFSSKNKFQAVKISELIEENTSKSPFPLDDLFQEPEDFGVL